MLAIARHSVRLANGRLRPATQTLLSAVQFSRKFNRAAIRCSPDTPAAGRNDSTSSNNIPVAWSVERAAENEKGPGAASGEAQFSEDAKRPLFRKTLRQRRNAVDPPPEPPQIPVSFLKYNVRVDLEPQAPFSKPWSHFTFSCIDDSTGRVLFTCPGHEALGTLWEKELQKHEVEGNDGDELAQVTAEDQARGQAEDGTVKDEQTASPPLHKVRQLPKDFNFFANSVGEFRHKNESSGTAWDAQLQEMSKVEPVSELFERLSDNDANSSSATASFNLLRFSILEAEASIRAGMTAGDSVQPTSLVSSRVDLSLVCPDDEYRTQVEQLVERLAAITDSDLIMLDASDLAELMAEYIGRDSEQWGQFSSLAYNVYHGFTASKFRDDSFEKKDEDDVEAAEESQEEQPLTADIAGMRDLKRFLSEKRHDLAKALDSIPVGGITLSLFDGKTSPSESGALRNASRSGAASSENPWIDARIDMLLDTLLHSPSAKRGLVDTAVDANANYRLRGHGTPQKLIAGTGVDVRPNKYLERTGEWRHEIARPISLALLSSKLSTTDGLSARWQSSPNPASETHAATHLETSRFAEYEKSLRPKIVHIRDLRDLTRQPLGRKIMKRLLRVVAKRRIAGERIVVVGTSVFEPSATESAQQLVEEIASETQEFDLPLRQITVPPLFDLTKVDTRKLSIPSLRTRPTSPITELNHLRVLEINLRHIQNMLRQIRPGDQLDLFSEESQQQLENAAARMLSDRVLSPDDVERGVLTAIGLAQSHVKSATISATHIWLAFLIGEKADEVMNLWAETIMPKLAKATVTSKTEPKKSKSEADEMKGQFDQFKKTCNAHETRLLPGIVNPRNIKVEFDQVHAPAETIATLKTLTTLSLTRPEAFQYGILAQERLTGLMLYGPPGTGKTLLAKAVAKQCSAVMLEISGAQIYEKYVGEGEKMVRAVFSLAKKIAPCIVFLDEADAIFAGRGRSGSRNSHREIINQFLREWDGMNSHDIFVMVASNRPFDMDEAVLRRLPRRLLVDLPVAKDREAILRIHLRDEQLEDGVSLPELAQKTPFYSGSDLKNVCVAAALACVREESDTSAAHKDDPEFCLPEKRTLCVRHFDKALQEISASISEDMSSLNAIRKFDERYGDGRGKKPKPSYGFGIGEAEVDETAVRVRQGPSP